MCAGIANDAFTTNSLDISFISGNMRNGYAPTGTTTSVLQQYLLPGRIIIFINKVLTECLETLMSRNNTNGNIATRVLQIQEIRLHMKGFIPKRNHINVNIATSVLLLKDRRLHMRGFIPMINYINVNIV